MKDRTFPFPSWLKEEGPESDIVLATRTTLLRNLSTFPFISVISDDQMEDVARRIEEVLRTLGWLDQFDRYDVGKLPELGRRYFEEEGTIPEDSPREHRYLYIQDEGKLLLAINVGDHLRIERRRGGFRIEEGFRKVKSLDLKLETHLDYAFSLEWGYLTTRVEDSGSGLSFTFVLHLPGISMKNELEEEQQRLREEGFLLRPLFLSTSADNETVALGELFLLEALRLTGKSEQEICKKLEGKVDSLLHYEREMREQLRKEQRWELEDRVYRALGVLERARFLPLEEALSMLSLVRFGTCCNLIPSSMRGIVSALMIESCPAHVAVRLERNQKGEEAEALERARYISSTMNSLQGRDRV
ncbi:MAG: protein arginine kinase [Spirochaetales bacterium]